MSPATSTLPTGWATILDQMHLHLDQALASANERMDAVAPTDHEIRTDGRRSDVNKWCERLQRLGAFLESAEQVVQSVDEALLNEEAILRKRLASSAALRQKLAQAPGAR